MSITNLKQTRVKETANAKDTGLPCSDVLCLFSAGKGKRSVGRNPILHSPPSLSTCKWETNTMRPIVTGHRLTLVDFCHWLVLTPDRGLRRLCSLLSQDMHVHVHVHVWMFLMRWFYFSEDWLDSILNKCLGHPIHRAKRAQVITNLKHKVWNQRED